MILRIVALVSIDSEAAVAGIAKATNERGAPSPRFSPPAFVSGSLFGFRSDVLGDFRQGGQQLLKKLRGEMALD